MKCPGDSTFTVLTPRQQLTAVPYALSLMPGATISGSTDVALTIENTASSASQAGIAVDLSAFAGLVARSSGTGVQGESTGGVGVMGRSPNAVGVQGESIAGTGVLGRSPTAVGVQGESTDGTGVMGRSPNAVGVQGESTFGTGVLGRSPNAVGVQGESTSGIGVLGRSPTAVGVQGESTTAAGVLGRSPNAVGVLGESTNSVGVLGESDAEAGVVGISTNSDGVRGTSINGGFGVYGYSPNGYAGYFEGNTHVNGTLSKAAGSFKIDHPLDPANKYLSHSFVESPDMKNIYDGVATTDANGEAVVELPSYFEALNRDFRYQLTVIGQFAQAIIAGEIAGNHFTIKTDKPNVRVSWQVTGIRQDAYANAHRIVAEQDKPPAERGSYLHPTELGQPELKGLGYQRQQTMRSDLQTAAPQPASATVTEGR